MPPPLPPPPQDFLKEGFALRGLSRQDMYALYLEELKEGSIESVLSGARRKQELAISGGGSGGGGGGGGSGGGTGIGGIAIPLSSRAKPLRFARASKASQVLSYEHLKHLAPHVPVANRVKTLKLVFSTDEHGWCWLANAGPISVRASPPHHLFTSPPLHH